MFVETNHVSNRDKTITLKTKIITNNNINKIKLKLKLFRRILKASFKNNIKNLIFLIKILYIKATLNFNINL